MTAKDRSGPRLSPAQVHWDEQGQPLSDGYDDVYFSRASGLDESRYVFIEHNRLPQRWAQLSARDHFTIGETGFGTGLNFLASWQLWQEAAPKQAQLHFISVERHPLSASDLTQALALWPELEPLAKALAEQYPPACSGYHRLLFDQGRVQLTLMFGEATDCFNSLDGRVDAWFLDGFAPAKNPQMWSDKLFHSIALHSTTQTTFSTFTAAGIVRRGLRQVGFDVNKVKGFGRKREMICGQFDAKPAAALSKPWFDRPQSKPIAQQACVIGAGLAGASSAWALAQRGVQVQLFERGPAPGCGASGNPQGVLYAKLPAQPTRSSRIHLSGYLFSLRVLPQLLERGDSWDPCGVLQLALNEDEQYKQGKLVDRGAYPPTLVHALDADRASQLSGVRLSHGGLFYPQAGWVSPAELCQAMLQHPNITCRFNQPVSRIEQLSDQQGWQLFGDQQQRLLQTDTLVIATAHDANLIDGFEPLPLKPIRGQTTSLSATQTPLRTVLCGNGYIAPARQSRYCLGASFDLQDLDPAIRVEEHRSNLALIEQLSPSLAEQLLPLLDQAEGRVGFRCAAPDYLPIVGAVPDTAAYRCDYAKLSKDAKASINTPPTHRKGLYVNLAHGSKGMITAPLCGQLLADLVLEHPAALERELLEALNPARFIIKKLIKESIN